MLSEDSIHDSRVDARRLLATFELLRKKFLETLRQYQTSMGDIQDAQIMLRAVDKFLFKRNINDRAGRKLRERVMAKRQALIKSYLGIIDEMKRFWPVPEAAKRSA